MDLQDRQRIYLVRSHRLDWYALQPHASHTNNKDDSGNSCRISHDRTPSGLHFRLGYAELPLTDSITLTAAGVDWSDSLVPVYSQNGEDPSHVAYVKCVFSVYQLAIGVVHLIGGKLLGKLLVPGT
jgi:hypothetical protein